MKKKIIGAFMIVGPFLVFWYVCFGKEVFIDMIFYGSLMLPPLVLCVVCVKKGIDLMVD